MQPRYFTIIIAIIIKLTITIICVESNPFQKLITHYNNFFFQNES